MPSSTTLLAFAATAALICVVPGPNVLYIVSRTLAEGRRAGVASVLGILCAGFVHVLLAGFGVSAILASSAVAYDAVRYAGAAYLVFLGLRVLVRTRSADEAVDAPAATRDPDTLAAFRQGFLVNLLNPKTALIYLSVLPQFVDAGQGGVAGQIVVLGMVLLGVGLLNDATYALGAGALASRLERRASLLRAGERTSGVIYVALGVGAALAGDRRSR